MIRRIEALNYRCLRDVSQELDHFQVLVGPNASGKTTFLDVVGFLGDLVTGDLDSAIGERTQNFLDLVWKRTGDRFELAIELEIPEKWRKEIEKPSKPLYSVVRYEVGIGIDSTSGEVSIKNEKVLLKEQNDDKRCTTKSIISGGKTSTQHNHNTHSCEKEPKRWFIKYSEETSIFVMRAIRVGTSPLSLGDEGQPCGNLPEDESKFPVALWLKRILGEGVQKLVLNSVLMRKPSPPGQPKRFRPDGSNLPWVIENLKKEFPQSFDDWLRHVQTALPDITDIRTVERPEDKHRYLLVCYGHELEVPSWTVSDGTLRLLALTLPAYLKGLEGVYLIEEPENGIHPRAVETMFQSLSSVYSAQILMATHSPVILSVAEASQILCFSKTESGAVDIVRGSDHPALRDWKGETNLGVLFAGGVLG